MAALTLAFELTTSISNLRHLQASDLGPYDAVSLGNIYCPRYEGNLLERPGDLARAVELVRAQGKRAHVATYAAPRRGALDAIMRAVEAGLGAGATAVEVHAMGVLKLVRDAFPGCPLHAGSFANVYTELGAAVLRDLGVVRIAPPHELPLDEVDRIAREAGVPVELTVHGKVPLGVSESCILLEHEAEWGVACPDLCQQDVFLTKDDWALKSVGTGILSGRDVCMLEHLGLLLDAGHRHFRVEAVSESPAYRLAIGAVYREALMRRLQGQVEDDPQWWSAVRAHARVGLANGFYFGRSGMEYVGGVSESPSETPVGGSP
jgi:putative protease